MSERGARSGAAVRCGDNLKKLPHADDVGEPTFTFIPIFCVRLRLWGHSPCFVHAQTGTDMRNLLLMGTAILLGVPAGTHAQDRAAGEATTLDTIVVTPLRRESTLAASTSTVTIIDRKEIDRTAAADLPSLLKSYPGVSITGYGGQGASSNVYLRGMGATQTLVLINGVRTASATSGTTSIFNIPLSAIERIEIAKGGHSAQYGADAIGGVINIITKDGSACPDGRARCSSITAGVTHPWGGYTNLNTRGHTEGGLDYSVGGQILGTRGYDFTTPLAWGHEPDDDGFLQGSFDFNLSQAFDWGKLYTTGLYSRGRSQYDATAPSDNKVDTDTFAGKAGARVDHSESWFSTVELSAGLDDTSNFRDGVAGSRDFDTRRYGVLASTQKTFDLGDYKHVLDGGVEAYREEVSSTTAYSVTERDLAAVFGQYGFEYDRLNVNAGLRYDHNEQFGSATTWNTGASYEIIEDVTLRASYSTGFRAPTFNDLYYPGYANPNLKPEKSRSYEVGALWQIGPGTSLDLAFYQTWLKDAIASNPPTYIPFNVARAKVTGFEAVLAHAFNDRWNGKATIDIRSPKNEDNGKYIPYRDRFKATAELGFKATEKLDLNTKVLYGASRYANAANTVELPSYVTFDVSMIYTLDRQSQFKLSVENVLDREYETITSYRAPGRTFNLSFTRTF